MSPRLVVARSVLPRPGEWVEGGGLLVVAGRVERVLRSRAAVRRCARAAGLAPRDLGDMALVPGLVDAHSHLELTGLRGRLPRGGFLAWVAALLEARARRGAARLRADAARGAARLLATGTTTSGDIDSTGAGFAGLARTALRARVYREVLDAWDPRRTAATLAGVSRALPRRRRLLEGLSPHAVHTASLGLLRRSRSLADRRRLAVAIHWSETPEERRWLACGDGPWSRLLGSSPRRTGLDLVEDAGLLRAGTSLIHGNQPARGEPARIAAAGVRLVHCPGTHVFFDRPAFPWRRYVRAGVRVALGTDSRASNDDLDMRREMALARRAAPWLAPADVLAMATTEAAEALGLAGQVGELIPGAWADWAAIPWGGEGEGALLEALTSGEAPVAATAVAGRRVRPPGPGEASEGSGVRRERKRPRR